jgi:hypothetical protein
MRKSDRQPTTFTPATTTIRVNAPAKNTPTAQPGINGRVVQGSYVAGEVVHVSRTDPANPKGTALPDATLSAGRHFGGNVHPTHHPAPSRRPRFTTPFRLRQLGLWRRTTGWCLVWTDHDLRQ